MISTCCGHSQRAQGNINTMTGIRKWKGEQKSPGFPPVPRLLNYCYSFLCAHPMSTGFASLPFLSCLFPFHSNTHSRPTCPLPWFQGAWPQFTPPGITSPHPIHTVSSGHSEPLFILQTSDALPRWSLACPEHCALCSESSFHVPLNLTISLFFRSQLRLDFLRKAFLVPPPCTPTGRDVLCCDCVFTCPPTGEKTL